MATNELDQLAGSKRLMALALLKRAGEPNPSLGGALAHGLAAGLMGLYEGMDERAGATALDQSIKARMGDYTNPMGATPSKMADTPPSVDLPKSSGSLTYAGDTPLPPPRPVFDRSRLAQEVENNPAIVPQLAAMVRGEVGDSASPEQKAIQLESLFNRTQGQQDKGMTLARGLSNGYYPPQTFSRGPGDVEGFKRDILPAVLRGSDISGQTIGFPATGNASGSVAQNGINSGRYSQYAAVNGPAGMETYVQQPNIENIQRLEATRVPQNFATDANGLPPAAQPVQFQRPQQPVQVAQAGQSVPSIPPQLFRDPQTQRLFDLYQKYPVGSREQILIGRQLAPMIDAERKAQVELQRQLYLKQQAGFADLPANAAAIQAAKTAAEEGTKLGLGPQIAAQKGAEKKATEIGELSGKAAATLPQAEAKIENAIKSAEALRNHPGRKSILATGYLGGNLPDWAIPANTEAKDFVNRMEQVRGQAFLSAYETLKGGGQITQIEGDKATAALSRLNRATTDKEYDAALNDFQDAMRTGMAKLREVAGAPPKQGGVVDYRSYFGGK